GEREGRVLPFTQFQQRLGRKAVTDDLLRDIPVILVAFDLLYRDGNLLFARPLTDRRALLADLLQQHDISLLNEDDLAREDRIVTAESSPSLPAKGAGGLGPLPVRLSRAQRVTEPA